MFNSVMIRSKREKEKRVIDLANQGKTTREIEKEVPVSPRSIGKILNKVTGDDVAEKDRRLKDKSEYAKAFRMFKDGRPPEDVAIKLDIEISTVICYYEDYLKIVNMRKMVAIYNDVKDDLPLFLRLYWRIKKENLNKQDIAGLLGNQTRLVELSRRVDLCNNHLGYPHSKKMQLEKEIEEKKKRLLDL